MAEWLFGSAVRLREQYLEPGNYLVPKSDALEGKPTCIPIAIRQKCAAEGKLLPQNNYDALLQKR